MQSFKKSLNRAGTTTTYFPQKVLQKTGQIERTVDREFADEESKYRAFEKECQALQKDSKTYGDAMRDRTSDGAMAGHAFKSAVEDLENSVQRELEAPYRTCIMEPLGKMNAYFPVINEHISKRNKKVRFSAVCFESFFFFSNLGVPKLLDHDSARSKLRKLIDKPSEDPTKLPKAQQEHDDTKEVFDMLNEQLIAELPQLLHLRVPYFDPSFEAMIRMQCKFAEDGYEKMSAVQRYFPDNVRDDYAAGQLDAQVWVSLALNRNNSTRRSQVEGVLQEMKELSICGAN
ncbi:hypothetical protein J3R83DRAFT_3651 [Lanmaoa asiatica]|nr:hypothetical protein J3R83DRAFT_3651 [Lanmaoa asiatica]